MGPFVEQPFALPHRFPHQRQLPVLEISKAAMNDSRRAARHTTGKIILLDQQRSFPGARTLLGHGHTVDAAADDDDVKVLALQ